METLRDLMTPDPIVLDAGQTVADAAKLMKQHSIGDVLVQRNGQLCGIVTDRDLVVRCLADGSIDSSSTPVGEVCTDDIATIDADAEVGDAIRLMEQRAIRRLPIVEGGEPVGIVTLGDLAVARDAESALGRISAAAPNS
jgi:CBS domain-containing protein